MTPILTSFWIFHGLLACQDSDKAVEEQNIDTTDTPESEDTGNTTDLLDEDCINDAEYFEKQVWGEALSPVCYSCHNAQGAAQHSDLVLQSNVIPGYLDVNRNELNYVASLEIDDVSLILRKPLGLNGHGGGAVIAEDSIAFSALQGFVDRLENPIESCPGDEEVRVEQSDLILATPKETLRKITLNLLGSLPTNSHMGLVAAG